LENNLIKKTDRMPFFASRQKFEAEISKRAAEACDQIMTQMGADLHDELVQKLVTFRLYMDRLDRSSTDPAEIKTIVIKMKSDFEQVNRTVKNISARLLPESKEGDTLIDMLKTLCQNMEHPGTGHIHFTNEGEPASMNELVQMHILRIVQELVQNAFKHSAAWHIWVRLRWLPERLAIEVEDDGSGFAKIPEFIGRLKKKNNTLKMRCQATGASIDYEQGQKGLLAKVWLNIG
jgi:signal transduction histidine kinase